MSFFCWHLESHVIKEQDPDPESSQQIQSVSKCHGSGTPILSGQEYLARVDSNVDGGSIGLLTLDPLDVDSKLGPVALDNLADLDNISHFKIQRAARK
jgi:hypothetical protein